MKILYPCVILLFFLFFLQLLLAGLNTVRADEKTDKQQRELVLKNYREKHVEEWLRLQRDMRFYEQINREWHGVRRYDRWH
jgi:hypothetical protein